MCAEEGTSGKRGTVERNTSKKGPIAQTSQHDRRAALSPISRKEGHVSGPKPRIASGSHNGAMAFTGTGRVDSPYPCHCRRIYPCHRCVPWNKRPRLIGVASQRSQLHRSQTYVTPPLFSVPVGSRHIQHSSTAPGHDRHKTNGNPANLAAVDTRNRVCAGARLYRSRRRHASSRLHMQRGMRAIVFG